MPSFELTKPGKKTKSGEQLKPKEVYYNRPFCEWYGGGSKKVEGEVGLEIECEGKNLFNTPLRYWKASTDNSLRNKDGHPPIEYVLRSPLPRDEIPKALSYLSKQLTRAQSEVDLSTRTSVHVHINCQQKTLKEIITFICLYLIFEDALVEFSGPTRVGNLFCLRAKDAEYWVWTMVQALKQQHFTSVFSENFRYTSCNTASLAKFGSLEFRSMRGTVSQELIQDWVDLLLYIQDESHRFSDPLRLYESFFNFGPEDFFKSIFFKNQRLYNLLKSGTTNLYTNMKENSVFVRDIAYALDEWVHKGVLQEEEEIPVITKKYPWNIYATVPSPSSPQIDDEVSFSLDDDNAVDPQPQDRYSMWYAAIDAGNFFENTSGEPYISIHPFTSQHKMISNNRRIYYNENGWICLTNLDNEVYNWLID